MNSHHSTMDDYSKTSSAATLASLAAGDSTLSLYSKQTILTQPGSAYCLRWIDTGSPGSLPSSTTSNDGNRIVPTAQLGWCDGKNNLREKSSL